MNCRKSGPKYSYRLAGWRASLTHISKCPFDWIATRWRINCYPAAAAAAVADTEYEAGKVSMQSAGTSSGGLRRGAGSTGDDEKATVGASERASERVGRNHCNYTRLK